MGKFLCLCFLLLLSSNAHAESSIAKLFVQLRDLKADGSDLQWRAVAKVPLYRDAFPTFHPQGIKVIGKNLFLSTVEGRETGAGHLIKYRLDMNPDSIRLKPIDRVQFFAGKNGRLIHAGGIDGDENSLTIPLAEYNSQGPTQLIEVNTKKIRQHKVIAWVDDHIGTVARFAGSFYKLFDWSSGFYSGTLEDFRQRIPQRQKSNVDEDWEYQDCKAVGQSTAICSAKNGSIFPSGEVHLVDFAKSKSIPHVLHRIRVPWIRSDGSVGGRRPLSYNAMDVQGIFGRDKQLIGIRFFFVPHDDEDSMLFVYDGFDEQLLLAGDNLKKLAGVR